MTLPMRSDETFPPGTGIDGLYTEGSQEDHHSNEELISADCYFAGLRTNGDLDPYNINPNLSPGSGSTVNAHGAMGSFSTGSVDDPFSRQTAGIDNGNLFYPFSSNPYDPLANYQYPPFTPAQQSQSSAAGLFNRQPALRYVLPTHTEYGDDSLHSDWSRRARQEGFAYDIGPAVYPSQGLHHNNCHLSQQHYPDTGLCQVSHERSWGSPPALDISEDRSKEESSHPELERDQHPTQSLRIDIRANNRAQIKAFRDIPQLSENQNAGPFVPQRLYRPVFETDQRRYVEEHCLEEPIYFTMSGGKVVGIPLREVEENGAALLDRCNEAMFAHCGPWASIRFEWPGYRSWSRQIRTKDYKHPPGPITRLKLVKEIFNCVQRFIKEKEHAWVEEDGDPRFRIGAGAGRIRVADLVLVSLHQVSKGSWQPQLRLQRSYDPP